MALNRYRLRHLARHKHRGAMKASKLLARPDRLIGLILGNNFVNILASSLATIIALRLWGEAEGFEYNIQLDEVKRRMELAARIGSPYIVATPPFMPCDINQITQFAFQLQIALPQGRHLPLNQRDSRS